LDAISVTEFTVFARGVWLELRRRAFTLCGDWHEAEDLAQTALIKLYDRWEELERREELAGYVNTVMVRAFISERRTGRWKHERLVNRLPERQVAPDIEARFGDRQLILAALDRLGPRQRAVVVLRYWFDMAPDEVAAQLDCTSATIRSQTSRALLRLRRMMVEVGPPT